MCCASCRHKQNEDLMKTRLCQLQKCRHAPQHCCPQWAMSDQTANAGRAGGDVKRREYLMYALEIRHSETLAVDMGLNVQPMSIAQIRCEFEQEHGSIFLTDF